MQALPVKILFPGILLLMIVMVLSSVAGAVFIPLTDFFRHCLAYITSFNGDDAGRDATILVGIRLPRVVLSAAVGAVMGICGAAMQGLFRNPLADPSVIGISAGASLAAAFTIVVGSSLHSSFIQMGFQLSILPLATFLGAIAATALIHRLSSQNGKTDVASMLLTGIAINAFSMAGTGLMTYFSTESQLRNLTFWTLGSLGGANWWSTAFMLATDIVVIVGLLPLHKSLNVLSLGEIEAQLTGIPVEKVKRKILIFTALGVGVSVSLCGIISFVGLIVPHLIRMMGKTSHQIVLPMSAIGGAILLCLADVVSRIMMPPTEIPVGVITALLGAPFFLYLLQQQKQNKSSF